MGLTGTTVLPGGPAGAGLPGAAGSTLAGLLLAADSAGWIWVVGWALALLFFALVVVPYLVARRHGFPAGAGAALVWAVAGTLLSAQHGDVDGGGALALGIAVFGAPWLLAAYVGGRAYERLREDRLRSDGGPIA